MVSPTWPVRPIFWLFVYLLSNILAFVLGYFITLSLMMSWYEMTTCHRMMFLKFGVALQMINSLLLGVLQSFCGEKLVRWSWYSSTVSSIHFNGYQLYAFQHRMSIFMLLNSVCRSCYNWCYFLWMQNLRLQLWLIDCLPNCRLQCW